MNKIVDKSYFSPNVVRLEIEAPLIAKARRAGVFVLIKVGEKGERIFERFECSGLHRDRFSARRDFA